MSSALGTAMGTNAGVTLGVLASSGDGARGSPGPVALFSVWGVARTGLAEREPPAPHGRACVEAPC